MIKDYCVSCGNQIAYDEERYKISGNFCGTCNTLASKVAMGLLAREVAQQNISEARSKLLRNKRLVS